MHRDDILATLKQHRDELVRHGARSLRLFGSVARDEAGPESDIDLLVDFDAPPTFSRYMELRILLEDLLGAKVDLITEAGLRARVRPMVERDAILVA